MKKIFEAVIIRRIRDAYLRLYHINETPHKVAMGFSIGVFIGIFPTFGLGGLIAIGICALVRLNYVSALIGSVIVMNPVTTPLFWMMSAVLGAAIFSKDAGAMVAAIRSGEILRAAGELTVIYLVGNIIISLLVSALSYFVVKSIMERHQRRHPGAGGAKQ